MKTMFYCLYIFVTANNNVGGNAQQMKNPWMKQQYETRCSDSQMQGGIATKMLRKGDLMKDFMQPKPIVELYTIQASC